MSVVVWQRLEGALVLAAVLAIVVCIVMAGGAEVPWWLMLIVFFAPDLGFLGYLAGPGVGARVYNVLHLYGAGLALSALGFVILGRADVVVFGLLWTGHVGFDRMLGYGLKAETGFSDTHLGRIGRK